LPVGKYEVAVDKPGFRTERNSKINLVVGQHAELDLTLQVGDILQTVEVHTDVESLTPTTYEASGLVGEQQVKDLPLNGRSYDQLLTLNPGAVNYTSQRAGATGTSNSVTGNMFSVSGRRPQENLFLLNDVEYTGASEINNTPGGVSGQLLGVDAVREFSVVKDTYGAEYGKRQAPKSASSLLVEQISFTARYTNLCATVRWMHETSSIRRTFLITSAINLELL